MLKGIKFIIACILSLTIIYVGAGVNLSHCRCARNLMAKSVAMDKSHCNALHGNAMHQNCCMHKSGIQSGKCFLHGRTDCCRTIIYKVDLQQDAPNTGIDTPAVALLPNFVLPTCNNIPTEIGETDSYSDPPFPDSSRFYLNLYSTLLI